MNISVDTSIKSRKPSNFPNEENEADSKLDKIIDSRPVVKNKKKQKLKKIILDDSINNYNSNTDNAKTPRIKDKCKSPPQYNPQDNNSSIADVNENNKQMENHYDENIISIEDSVKKSLLTNTEEKAISGKMENFKLNSKENGNIEIENLIAENTEINNSKQFSKESQAEKQPESPPVRKTISNKKAFPNDLLNDILLTKGMQILHIYLFIMFFILNPKSIILKEIFFHFRRTISKNS